MASQFLVNSDTTEIGPLDDGSHLRDLSRKYRGDLTDGALARLKVHTPGDHWNFMFCEETRARALATTGQIVEPPDFFSID